ncbi:MAG TPA: molybdopterin cofactor-binding domain-containing protein [Blastocatellia bacterium]|nr:molybdopterin cofactor-binding domain-containing protein [Blastocatellia bacterium]
MTEPNPIDLYSEMADDELPEPVAFNFALARRDFFKTLGGGLCVALLLTEGRGQDGGPRGSRPALPPEIGAWLQIDEDGKVTAFTGKVEIGQNIRTSLSQVVADELRVPISAVRLVMADTGLTPFDPGTTGSRTTPDMASRLRRIAAATRELLIEMAAETWTADRQSLAAGDGKISNPATGQALSYGQLTKGRKLMKAVGNEVAVTPATQWKIAGQSVPKVDGPAFVTGKHRYTSDLKLPGMLYGKVLRPASIGAAMTSVETGEARALPEVTVVHDGDFVGVAAPTAPLAARALAAIKAEWRSSPHPSSRELFEYLKTHPLEGGAGRAAPTRTGNVKEALAACDRKLERTYTVHYIAHVPLEPRAALAEWKDGKLTVWTGTQRPFGVRGELARVFRLSEESVRVIVPDTGSGYGGKHTGEVAIEAARLARAAGKPVKLVWTREEEFSWAYFRPAGVIDVIGGIGKDGTLTAWEFHSYSAGPAAIRTPYEIPNQHVEMHPTVHPLRTGSYRGLAATANNFARESQMDELAQAAQLDPFEFRRRHLPDVRLKAVLEASAKAFGWGQTKAAPGRGCGIACGTEKGGYVATCAEVEVDRQNGRVKIARVVTAFECGAIVNPDHLKNQIEGAIMMGLGGALFESMEFAEGKIRNPRLSLYRVPRFDDLPLLQTVLVNRPDLPSAGAGETPMIALAPAIGNAIAAAAGIRLRELPLLPDGRRLRLE